MKLIKYILIKKQKQKDPNFSKYKKGQTLMRMQDPLIEIKNKKRKKEREKEERDEKKKQFTEETKVVLETKCLISWAQPVVFEPNLQFSSAYCLHIFS